MSNISVLDYFKSLQLEYVEFEIRKKIYPIIKEKQNFKKILDNKKRKIFDIANRNKLKSIFNDPKVKDDYYNKVYNEYGFPNFTYKESNGTLNYQDSDEEFYYTIGCDVKCRLDNDNYIFGKIHGVDFSEQIVEVYTTDDEIKVFDINDIARIL